MTTTGPRYVITLLPMPDPNGIDPVRRLAQLLKVAGRRFRLRCTDCREARPDAPQISSATTSGTRSGARPSTSST